MDMKQITEDEANQTLAMLQDEQMERANEILDEVELEEQSLAGEPPIRRRDPVFPNEKGPMTFGSIDK
jgi:hypothetical protein